MSKYTYCVKHLGKIIFHDVEDGLEFIRVNRPGRYFEVYPCPTGVSHYHIRDKTKRNNTNRARTLRRRDEAIKRKEERGW